MVQGTTRRTERTVDLHEAPSPRFCRASSLLSPASAITLGAAANAASHASYSLGNLGRGAGGKNPDFESTSKSLGLKLLLEANNLVRSVNTWELSRDEESQVAAWMGDGKIMCIGDLCGCVNGLGESYETGGEVLSGINESLTRGREAIREVVIWQSVSVG